MRKIIVYIATSADGFIARKDGAVDWLDRPHTAGDYGMGKFYKSIDTILWGRNTADLSSDMGGDFGGSFDKNVRNYVFTHRPPKKEIKSVDSSMNRSKSSPGACVLRKEKTSG